MRGARLAQTGLLLLLAACSTLAGRAPPLPGQARTDPQRFLVITVRNETRVRAVRAGSTPRGYDSAAHYGVTAEASAAVHALEHEYGLTEVSAWPIETLHVHCVMFRLPPSPGEDALVARLERDPRVESVQPLNAFRTEAQPAPENPAWMPYNDPYGRLQSSLRELGVIEAQQRTRGQGVRIAIIDTGVDLGHPDLQGRDIEHRNFVDADEQRFRADVHGTEVTGVIAAATDNGIGIVGIAPESHILALKACWQASPADVPATCNSFTLAQAIEAAITAHADIVNMSLAGPSDPLLARLIRAGAQQGMVFVAAVAPQGGAHFPASLDAVLAVASAEERSAHALAAPGHEVLTLTPGGHYDFATGSSFAAAQVTGIVALLLAQRPHLGVAQVRAALERSAAEVDAPSGVIHSVNACAALRAALAREGCGTPALVGARPQDSAARR